MMRRYSFPAYIFSVSLLMLGAQQVFAEDVALPIGAQGDTGVRVPGRAWTQSKVQESFGTPISRRGPVGEPPITTWEYADFSVYFEHNLVIHSVKNYRAEN